MVSKANLSERRLKLIENEIVNQDCSASQYVVKIRRAIETPDNFYIFMEYCNGGDLKDLLDAKGWKLSYNIIHKIMKQLI